jgi:hypothetical protein
MDESNQVLPHEHIFGVVKIELPTQIHTYYADVQIIDARTSFQVSLGLKVLVMYQLDLDALLFTPWIFPKGNPFKN